MCIVTYMTEIRITEHTTTDDTYCEIENMATGQVGEFYGTSDEFIAEVADPQGFKVVEVIWS